MQCADCGFNGVHCDCGWTATGTESSNRRCRYQNVSFPSSSVRLRSSGAAAGAFSVPGGLADLECLGRPGTCLDQPLPRRSCLLAVGSCLSVLRFLSIAPAVASQSSASHCLLENSALTTRLSPIQSINLSPSPPSTIHQDPENLLSVRRSRLPNKIPLRRQAPTRLLSRPLSRRPPAQSRLPRPGANPTTPSRLRRVPHRSIQGAARPAASIHLRGAPTLKHQHQHQVLTRSGPPSPARHDDVVVVRAAHGRRGRPQPQAEHGRAEAAPPAGAGRPPARGSRAEEDTRVRGRRRVCRSTLSLGRELTFAA
jgi:hypothetical protein